MSSVAAHRYQPDGMMTTPLSLPVHAPSGGGYHTIEIGALVLQRFDAPVEIGQINRRRGKARPQPVPGTEIKCRNAEGSDKKVARRLLRRAADPVIKDGTLPCRLMPKRTQL
jgi:hypothetical protein